MANGPPTPPPTTEAEIQDEARQPVEPVAHNVLPPQAGPTDQDAYWQSILPTIADLASQSSFDELIRIAESADLNSDANSDRRLTRMLVTAPLVLAYLIIDDLAPARFALMRLPDDVSSSPLAKALIELLASTWERKHASVYSRAENLFDLVHQPDFFHEKLASILTDLVASFVESFRQRTFTLLSKAYASLPVPLAQVYLGMKNDELLVAAQKAQWSYDPSTNILIPQVPSSVAATALELTFSSLSTFHFVANSVAKLEL
ncbi:putative CSN8/PSMD8/EIF3K family protein [Lyophyllum shimeji]|uniref:CSN8/PSMD8/EIF3K family protein n=1 Tax=Lyophyllum shimeji TaxID=47721 RepID=A0A9P3PFY2_LYOSH|nr:putative CSN8/PSMD8/EIF3K family protein [Lyophyllum shimeji]